MIWSRDIVFMEEKIIAGWESDKKTTSSESTERVRLEEARVYPDGNRIPVEEQYEPAGFRQEIEDTERGKSGNVMLLLEGCCLSIYSSDGSIEGRVVYSTSSAKRP